MHSDPVTNPGRHDHFVQLYQELDVLTQAVARYIGTGLARGEAAIVIATPAHRAEFVARIAGAQAAIAEGRFHMLDADDTLARFMANGMPQWQPFREAIGGLIAELRLRYPTVRAYGEMVDLLWQRGEREAAIRLEQYWNELGQLQTFSLFCAYHIDPLDSAAYGGPLESVCTAHTHFIPTQNSGRFDEVVYEATHKVLDSGLAHMLVSLAAKHRPGTEMPAGQAMLFWLKQNMPRTAEKVLSALRAESSPAAE